MKRVVVCFIGLMYFMVLSGVVQGFDPDQAMLRLAPENPAGYLELGERTLLGGDRDKSVELFVRAVFWGDQQGESKVSSSACIALTGLVSDESTRRWLWDLALLLDPTRVNEWDRWLSSRDTAAEELSIEASQCLYAIRYHQQPLGEDLFKRPQIRARILEAGETAGVDREQLIGILEREIRNGRDDSCRGRLYIADRGSAGRRLACPDHLRGLGMCANDDDLRVLLRVEMVLGQIEVQSWQAAAWMSMDEVVILPTVADLVRRMGVEPGKAFYRDGRWVTTP